MANRSEGVGRGYQAQAQALVEMRGQEDGESDAIGGPAEVGSGGSAWEQMLEALTSDDDDADTRPDGGSLRASIAERLHTRGGSPANNQAPGEAPDVRPVRRRRRPL